MPRLFLAIPLPWEVKQTLSEAAEQVKSQMPHSRVSWVQPEQYHITLHFLGDIDEELEDRLISELKAGNYPKSFQLTLKEVSAFPDKKHPQTILVKTTVHSFAIELYKKTGGILANLGFELDRRPWAPHITLGRVKVQSEVLKPDLISIPEQNFRIESFVLMASTLTQEGSFYDIVEEINL
jgi:2'-5' RNA ligase